MKILCLTQDINSIGGIGNYFRCLYPCFTLHVDYLITGSRLSSGKIQNIIRLFKDYYTFLKTFRTYDLVHINTSMRPKAVLRDMLFLLFCRLRHQKTMVFIHGWDERFTRFIDRWSPAFIRFALLKTDAVVVLASNFKNQVYRWGYHGPVFLLTTFYNEKDTRGVDEQLIHERARKRPVHILFLARLEKEKGLLASLFALEQLRNDYSDIQLHIAGIGSQLQAAKDYVQRHQLPAVFHGFVQGKEKIKLLQQSHILLLPTTYGEGMPTAVLEGMAFGCSVITCPAGAIRDFFQPGKMGFLCEKPEPQNIAEFLTQLIHDPELQIQIGLFNFKYAKQHFTSKQALQKLERIYVNIVQT